MRLDKYLKVSRLIKRRTVANEACDAEKVSVNGKPARASYDVKEGDIIEINIGAKPLKVRVLDVKEFTKKEDAALDPKTAAKVLQLSDEIIAKNHLTAMMVTHNMANAIEYGNRLIMMNDGKIIYDVKGEEKKKLTVDDLLQKFEEASGSALNNDRMLLSGNK